MSKQDIMFYSHFAGFRSFFSLHFKKILIFALEILNFWKIELRMYSLADFIYAIDEIQSELFPLHPRHIKFTEYHFSEAIDPSDVI